MPQATGGIVVEFFVKVIVAVGLNIIAAKVTKALQKRAPRVLQKVDVAYQGGLEPRRRLYGYFRASGLDCMPAAVSGPTGTRLHRLIALSDGEIASVDSVEFNNDVILSSQITGGVITSGPYAGYAQIFPKLGLASQSVPNGALLAAGWTTEHRGDGVAYVYMFFEASNEVYKAGAPNVIINGQGNKIYDPRLDTSPGANPTSGTYKAFSTNPALILADFLIWSSGGNELPANIVWSDVVACANTCDGTVTIPNGAGGTTTQPRYTCSIEVYAPQTQKERDDTIAMLARAMMGACWFADGKWHMRVGAYSSPVGPFVDNDFLGDSLSVATAQSRAQSGIFNTVRGSFVDAGENTQPKSFPEVSSAAFIADDGEVMYTDVEFRTARTAYEAQRNAILLLRQSRRRKIVSGTMRFKASGLQLYDVVNLTLSKIGWVSQTARVIRIRHFQNFTVGVELQEIESGDYADPTTTEYIVPGAIAAIVSSSYTPTSPSNLRATSLTSAVLLEWNPPANAPIGVLYRIYEYASSTPFSSATQVGSDTAQTSIVVPRTNTTVTYFWVVAVDPSTLAVSSQSPPTNGVPGSAATASSALSAVVTPGSATSRNNSASQTTSSVGVTAIGGTSPYTYSWTFTSGGTGITITNSSSSSTTFSATGLSDGETRSGTARCRVTDNVSATFDVSVAVTITRDFTIVVDNYTVTSSGGSMTPAVSSAAWTPDGIVQCSDGNSYRWGPVGVTSADYDVRYTPVSGTLQSGSSPVNTWLQLSTGRAWVGARSPGEGPGSSTQVGTIEIRLHNSPFTVQDSGSLTLSEGI